MKTTRNTNSEHLEVAHQGQDLAVPHLPPQTRGRDWVLLSLLLACMLVHVATWIVCLPTNRHADTEEYAALAYRFMTHDFRNYSADRTPVYSFLLLAARFDYRVVWFIQNILGIATSLLLYALAKDRSRNQGLAFLAGAWPRRFWSKMGPWPGGRERIAGLTLRNKRAAAQQAALHSKVAAYEKNPD